MQQDGDYMFSDQLKRLRTNMDISQKKLAERLFVSQQTIAKWETDRATPNPDMLLKIAQFFDVTVDFLVGNKNELDDFQFAMYGETQDLSDAQKQDILKFIRFVKTQEQEKKG